MNDEELAALLHSLGPRAGEVRPEVVNPKVIARTGRRRRTGRFTAIGAAVAVVAAGIAVPVTIAGSRPTPRAVVTVGVPGIPTADELTVDGMLPLACGVGPLSALTASDGAEKADTPEAAGLRNAIAHDDTGGESPLPAANWVLLAEHDGKAYFGQRTGAVGIGATVTMDDKNGVWVRDQSGGCGPVGYSDGRTAQPISYLGMGRTLLVFDEGGACGDYRPPTAVHVHEHATTVDVLAVSQPPPGPGGNCVGLAVPATIVTLTAPLGTRTVRDVGYVPPRLNMVGLLSQLNVATPAARFQAAAACTRAARAGAGRTSFFVTDVATVRGAAAAARTSWRTLPSDQPAGTCYQSNGDGSYTQRVATADAAPITVDRHYTDNPLAVVPGQSPQP